jgi:hypothetical protein
MRPPALDAAHCTASVAALACFTDEDFIGRKIWLKRLAFSPGLLPMFYTQHLSGVGKRGHC